MTRAGLLDAVTFVAFVLAIVNATAGEPLWTLAWATFGLAASSHARVTQLEDRR